jgi:hypothetical protein
MGGIFMVVKFVATVSVSLFLSLSATASYAQKAKTAPASEPGIDKQCLGAKNKRGCTCAIETGGTMVNGRWTYYNARSYGDCMMKKGWL